MAQQQNAASISDISLRARPMVLISLAVLAALLIMVPTVPAQTFQVIHTFTGGASGYYPANGVVMDRAGSLYGATAYGGNYTSSCNYEGTQTGCGVAYKISHHGSGWIFNVLSSFDGANGYNPAQVITVAPDGTLFGTTMWGGAGQCHSFGPGCGTIFRLRPPATFCAAVSCPWTVSDLHQFLGPPNDGALPQGGSLTMDAAGNFYGTTVTGGLYDLGTVYELSPTANGWTMSVLYNFAGYDGEGPEGGVVFDNAGNLYGVTVQGGEGGLGAAYQLTPTELGWKEHVLHSFNFQTDGAFPSGNLAIDASGNVYGTTESYGPNNGGTIWELSPGNGSWNFSVLYSFSGGGGGGGPFGGLLLDGAGSLYGTTINVGAYKYGAVFKLTPDNGGWNFTSLHDFTGGSDGGLPYSSVSMDSAGNLFGVTEAGGSLQCPGGCGVVWEIMP